MGFKRFTTGTAIAALLTSATLAPAVAQTAPAQTPQAAGTLNPAAEDAPVRAAPQTRFQMTEGVVATVNDRIITGWDLRQRMLTTILMSQVQPTPETLPALQQQALNDLIDERLQAQELAKFEQLKISDEEVDREMAQLAREIGVSTEDYLRILQEAGIQLAPYRESIRTRLGWSDLTVGRFRDRAKVSRSQVDQAMRQITESATKPQYLIGEIYLDATRVGGMQEAVNGARQLISQMVQGAPFQAVARQFSSAPTAARNGDAGWVVQGTVHPALQSAMDVLEVGQLSNPIVVENGVYIIYMRDKRAGAATSHVSMKQVMIELPETATEAQVTAAAARLNALRSGLTCDNILERARAEQGVLGSDLGEAEISNLLPQFQQVARSATVGSVSDPVRSPLGLHLLAVCDRRVGGPEVPSRQQIENRMQGQNFAMLGRRYLHDLREDALIEIKQ
ncbi:peptidylprolyl isomerase [uncultured Brevundimonas sp.]|uniref:peptidylprolyl isomerase n=1 Tax=uncultured Brevundimonas sp. TaxID=213418 RepID=UPI002619B52F|nr:peptidylprolyl isomerase [uncultured Brevundimonas sp.]